MPELLLAPTVTGISAEVLLFRQNHFQIVPAMLTLEDGMCDTFGVILQKFIDGISQDEQTFSIGVELGIIALTTDPAQDNKWPFFVFWHHLPPFCDGSRRYSMQTFLEYVKGRSVEKKRLDKIGDFVISTVNASAVRLETEKEFPKFGTHIDCPKVVPNKEIWIANDVSAKERQFLIHNAISQYEAKEKNKRSWTEYAAKKEKAEREKVEGIKSNPHSHDEKAPQKVYYKYYCGIPSEDDDIEVWLVDGELVRDLYKTNFFEGGNGEVYKWIPRQEIWIEKGLKEDEIDIVILHEYIERILMRYKKMNYDKAHTIASKVDWKHRKKWEIEDVKALDKEEALDMVKKYL